MLLFPDSVEFSYKPVKRKPGAVQRYRFVYTETFVKPPAGILDATLAMLEAPMKSLGFKVSKVSAKSVRIEGVTTRENIANMLVGEFLAQSDVGSVTLSQVLQSAAYGAIQSHGAPRFSHPPKEPFSGVIDALFDDDGPIPYETDPRT
jgi:hypothetical protein